MLNQLVYPQPIEIAIAKIESLFSLDYERYLSKNYHLSKRSLALLLLQKDPDFWAEVQRNEQQYREIEAAIRLPKLKNILIKTWVRMKWYFLEIIPIFIWASVFIWIGRLTGLFDAIIRAIEPITLALGLPKEAALIFLYGFFRRDYGAAGLFDMQQEGIFNGNQLLVAAVVLTLFLPCIAQLQMMLKERGAKTTIAITAFIFPFAFLVGYLMNLLLTLLGVNT
ncbi:MAG TPA: nucleoside recognition domain-containing protein [Leptolyngbyaceae cyanobacterium]